MQGKVVYIKSAMDPTLQWNPLARALNNQVAQLIRIQVSERKKKLGGTEVIPNAWSNINGIFNVIIK
jgi:hypothetical protein